jgi:hypothetical protein
MRKGKRNTDLSKKVLSDEKTSKITFPSVPDFFRIDLIDDSSNYIIMNFMVTNKLFEAFNMDIYFEIAFITQA